MPFDLFPQLQQPQSNGIIDQSGILAMIQEEVRKKKEEEEERRRKAEEMAARLLAEERQRQAAAQAAAQATARPTAQPRTVAPELSEAEYAQEVMARRANPEREARLRRMREETPEEIQQRMYDSYWGAPKGKLGKIGTAVLKIASGALGAPTPDFRKEATQQWIQQNKIANEEESNEGRLATAEMQSVARNNASVRTAKTAEERNRTMMGIQIFKNQLGEARLEAEKARDAKVAAGIDSKIATEELQRKEREAYTKGLGRMAPYFGKDFTAEKMLMAGKQLLNDPALTAEQRGEIFDSMQFIAKVHEANKQVDVGYTAPTPDRSISTVRHQVIVDPNNSSKSIVAVPGERTVAGRPGKGDPQNKDALTRALQGELVGRETPLTPQQPILQLPPTLQQPQRPVQQPGMQQPIVQAQAQVQRMQQPQALQQPRVQPQKAQAIPEGLPPNAKEYFAETRVLGTLPSANRVRVFRVPPPGVTTIVEGVNPKIKEADTASNSAQDAATQSLRALTNYYASGDLDNVAGNIRFLTGQAGLRKLNTTFMQAFGSQRQKDVEADLQRLFNEETAATVKRWSGAQSSEAEFNRLRETTPQSDNAPDRNLRVSYWNALLPSVLIQMERMGALSSSDTALRNHLGDTAGSLIQEKMDEYISAMKNIKAKGNTKEVRAHENLSQYTDVDAMVAEVLRRAFPGSDGKVIPVRHNSSPRFSNDTMFLQVPGAATTTRQTPGNKKQEEDARDAWLRWRQRRR